MHSVLQPWTQLWLTMRQQTVLLSAIRGPDGIDKYDFARRLVRLLRADVLADAAPGNGFMDNTWPTPDEMRDNFFKRLDAYPFHWLIHFMHAAEVIAYGGPDKIAAPWEELYLGIVEALHLNPETPIQMRQRFADGGDRGCWKN